MKSPLTGNRPETRFINVVNSGASIAILAGTPVVLDYTATGTNLGRGVVASESGVSAGIRMGMAVTNIAARENAEILVYGPTSQAILVGNGRAASTDTWASVASIAQGVIFAPRTGVVGVQGWVSTSGFPTTSFGVLGVLLASVASRATQASTYLGTRLGDTVGGLSLFLREL